MPLILGIDIGGSFTDCVVLAETGGLIAKAKVATTPRDLALGLGEAVAHVLAPLTAKQKASLFRVCLTTSLASNAMLEVGGELSSGQQATAATANPLLAHCLAASKQVLADIGITAPLLVVAADGTLVSAAVAADQPRQIISSGVAASIAGASHLLPAKNGDIDAIMCDIGGGSTNIALLNRDRAIGATACHSYGLGGDSEVRVNRRPSQAGDSKLYVGPRRFIPISFLAHSQPKHQAKIHAALDSQLKTPIAIPSHGKFVIPLFHGAVPTWLSKSEAKMAGECAKHEIGVLADIAATRLALAAIDRLATHGLIRIAGFTPTDALHVLGKWDAFDRVAASKAATLLARQKITTRAADIACADSPEEMAEMTIKRFTSQVAQAVLDSADAIEAGGNKLALPLIAIGGAAGYCEAVAARLGTRLITPPQAEVAGAIGAASCGMH